MAIEDLTNQLKMLTRHGGPDLQFSEATRDAIVGLIKEFRSALTEQRDKAAYCQGILYPGNFRGALAIRDRLMDYVTGMGGILETLDKYIQYLDELETTVNAAFKRMQAEDQS